MEKRHRHPRYHDRGNFQYQATEQSLANANHKHAANALTAQTPLLDLATTDTPLDITTNPPTNPRQPAAKNLQGLRPEPLSTQEAHPLLGKTATTLTRPAKDKILSP